MKKILLSLIVMAWLNSANSQSFYEALRYSQAFAGGTARGLGSGSAFGALGADYTSVGINPGGLGVYRNSEFFISVNFNNTKSTSNFNNTGEQIKLNLHPANYGIVLNKMFIDKNGNQYKGKWIGMNFAIGMNRIANFNSKRFYENSYNAQSILPLFASDLNGLSPGKINYNNAGFEQVLAYTTYLVNPDFSDSTLYNSVTDNQAINKQISVSTSGRIDELSFAIATNFDEKLFFGGTLGIPIINYNEDIQYNEFDLDKDVDGFNSFELNRKIQTTGAGLNLKLGAIYRVNDWIRLGASLHTPSYLGLKDSYNASIYADLDSLSYSDKSPDGKFNYNLLTPWKAIGSFAFMIKKYGFLSIDYEYSDFRKARYNFSNEYQSYESKLNKSISNNLNISHTIRAGAEAVIKDFRLRGGYNYSKSPLASSLQNTISDDDRAMQSISGGLGYRGKKFNLDFAFIRTITDNSVMLSNNIVSADRLSRNNYVMTFGYRF
jgi:hypothetical protein